ncbi:MAG: hypothetical protein DYH12_10560, partial [Sorangiineae bacterium PRO1]|nr:hypothetical protein [Sorangiineae bacterium PRO1]
MRNSWDRGCEPTEQGERVEVDGRGAVGERTFQQDADEPAAEPAHTVRGERRAQDVLDALHDARRGAERLASAGVAGGSGGGGVHGEAVLAGGEAGDGALAVLGQRDGGTLAVLGPRGWVAGDGGGGEGGELRLALGEA